MSDPMPMIVPPLFWEWFNIWLIQFLKDLYHEIKMVGLRGGSNSNNPYSHTCANHGIPPQATGIDMTLNIPTSLTMTSPAGAHLNPNHINLQSLSTVSLQFIPSAPQANHSHHSTIRSHNHVNAANQNLNQGHSHASNLGLGVVHNHSNNHGMASSHNHTNSLGLGGSHSHTNSLGLNVTHSHSNSVGLGVNHSNSLGHGANNTCNLGLGSSHNHNLVLGGGHSHSSNIGLGSSHSNLGPSGNHSHATNLGIGGSHGHTVNLGLTIGHSHSSSLAGSHSHTNNLGLGGSHCHSSNLGLAGSHSNSHGVSSGHSHNTSVGLGGSHNHNSNLMLGGNHSHSNKLGVSSSQIQSSHHGMSGSHSHSNKHALSDNHSHVSKTGPGCHSHGHKPRLGGNHNNNTSLGGHNIIITNVNSTINHTCNNLTSSQLNSNNTSCSHNQTLKVEPSRYSTTSCALPSQAQQYRLLKQVCRPVECYHPSGAATATYMSSSTGSQASSQASLRVQTAPAQPSAPPAPQQDLSKTSLAGHNFVSQTQTPRPYANFPQYRPTQHGSRPNSHPRQQQPFISSAASTTGPMMYPIVFQPTHMGMPTYQQPRSGSPGYYQYHMGHYIHGYNNQPSHTNPYYGYATNSPQLPTPNLQSSSTAGRSNPNALVGPQGSPATPAAPAVSLPHAQPPQHLHQSMSGIHAPPVQKRSHRLAIIDPATNQDIFSDPSNNEYNASGEQNERRTPQLEPPTHSIAEEFTRMVNEAVNQPSVENAAKTNFVPKNIESPVSSTITAQPQNAMQGSMSSINNNVIKSDLVNINDNRSLGTDAAVASCETPVVSAISDSPVIVPKMTLNVKPIQKIETTVQSIVVDTNKNMQINKQSKITQPSEKVDSEKEAAPSAPAPASIAPAPAPAPATAPATPPAPVSAPAPVHAPVQNPPFATPAPQPQRAPRERQQKSEEKDKHTNSDKDITIVPTKQNGPTMSVSISSVDSFQQAISVPTSHNILNQAATLKKHAVTKPVAPIELAPPAPEHVLTATQLLSASIEKVAREHPYVPEPEEKKFSGFEAQAKLTQSITSVCRAQQAESKMKDINLNSQTTDPDTANGNASEVTKPNSSKEDINKNDKSVKSTKNNSKKAAKIANIDGVMNDTVSCENGKEETEKVVNVEQEASNEPAPEEENPVENVEESPVISEPAVFVPKYKYSDEQWSPLNKSGKKCYDIGLLKQIKDDPMSKIKPNAPSLEACNVIRTAPMQEPSPFTPISRPVNDSLFPTFLKAGLGGTRNASARDPKKDGRNMQITGKGSVKLGQSGGSNSSHKPVIHVSLSLREDVKLKQVDSAWKPTRFVKENLSEEELKTQDMYKKFRGILNKLTPQKFETLLKKVLELEINNQKRMEGVIDLLFEKAIEEPNFSEAYANMCSKLSNLKVPSDKDRDTLVNFRGLIISKCQTQFMTGKSDEQMMKMEKDLAECTDPAKKKELQMMIVEENRKIRLRAVANVRFIGELYKLKMLTCKIMDYCMNNLIEKLEEEKLECLCKLLTTIGEQVENEPGSQLHVVFKKMQDIVDRKSNKISSRVKFMLQDVIDLKRRKWIVKSVTDSQPKMMDQIQKEAEQQARHIELMNAGGMGGGGGGGSSGGFRRDDGGRNKRGGDNRRQNFTDNTYPRTSRPTNSYNNIDKVKLQQGSNQKSLDNIVLAPPQWNHKASGAKPQQAQATSNLSIANKYILLRENVQDPTSPLRDTTPTYSKGASIERSTFNSRGDFNATAGGGRSGSVGLVRSNSGTRSQSSAPVAAAEAPAPAPSTAAATAVAQDQLPEDKVNMVKSMVEQSLFSPDDEEFKKDILEFEPKYHAAVITEILNLVVDKNVKQVSMIAKSLEHIVATNTITPENFIAGLNEPLKYAPDLLLDIPLLYENLGKILAPHIEKKHITFAKTFDLCETIIAENQGHLILKAIIHCLNESMGPTFVKSKWQESGLQLSQWMSDEQVPKWIADNKFEFLEGGSQASEESAKILTPAETQSRLLQLMNSEESCDCVKGWVQDKLGKASNEDWFMRALIQAICEHALYGNEGREVPHFNQDRMTKYAGLIVDFGESKESKEANCLFGIQHLIHRLEHPQGLTLEIFQYLHEQYLISLQGFFAWEKSDKEPEGKGVMLMALTSFFTNIREADNEDSGSED